MSCLDFNSLGYLLHIFKTNIWSGISKDTFYPLQVDNDSSLLFAALGKAEPLISTAERQKLDLDPWPQHSTLTYDLWHRPWPLTLTLMQSQWIFKHEFWHLTLTFDLRPLPTRSIPVPKFKVIGQEVQTEERWQTHKHIDERTDGRALPSALSFCFAKLCGQ